MTPIEKYAYIASRTQSFDSFKENIFKHTLKWESGDKLHNVLGDSGGWTLWGIAYNYNKGLFKNFDDFKDTTYDEAAAIALVKYFLPIKAHRIKNENVALMAFDMAYNMGVHRAKILLQRCAGVKEDGVIGPITLKAFDNLTPECLYKVRKGFYNRLVKRKEHLKKFYRGWMNRLNYMYKQ